MKKQLATFALALLMGVVGFAAAGVAVAANEKPPSPPGQGECEHGNSGKPCRDDPQPEKGKDCEEHGHRGDPDPPRVRGSLAPFTLVTHRAIGRRHTHLIDGMIVVSE